MLSKWIRARYDRCVLEGTVSSVNRSMLIEISQAEINQIAALESENARLRAMVEWQPIEEAPRDRTDIEVIQNGQIVIGCFYEDNPLCVNHRGLTHPTHFRLLPPPPEK